MTNLSFNGRWPARLMLAVTLMVAIDLARAGEPVSSSPPSVSVFAGGLNNPRGLKFGPDGDLYVAEGGVGGSHSTVGQCEQVPAPIGPYTGNDTGSRVSRIRRDGTRVTVVDNLPSTQTTADTGGFVMGVGDIEFLGDTLYVLLAGAGCSHGVPDVPNALLRVNRNGTTTMVADLSAFQQANPVAHPDPDDFEPDGTWYSMVNFGGAFYAVEPNHSEIDRITRRGHISRLVDMSVLPWIGPSAITVHDGNFYAGPLTPFPIVAGVADIYKITPHGDISVYATGLTAVLGVAFHDDELYVLEMSAQAPQPGPPVVPASGQVVKVTRSGALEPVVTGLMFPTAMTFGPEGDLYISNFGFAFPPGSGQIVRVRLPGHHE